MIIPAVGNKQQQSIVIGTKRTAVWDVARLAKLGGTIPVGDRCAIRYIKDESKWGELVVVEFGLYHTSGVQKFESERVVKDTTKNKELREKNKQLEGMVKSLSQRVQTLLKELSQYKTTANNVVNDEVEI